MIHIENNTPKKEWWQEPFTPQEINKALEYLFKRK